MISGNVSRPEAWAEFVRLTHQARVRNNSENASTFSVKGSQSPSVTPNKNMYKAFSLPTQDASAQLTNVSPGQMKNVRILGGNFDAYA